MNNNSYDLHGVSLIDYINGETSNSIAVLNDAGERIEVPVSIFFRDPADWPLDRKAVELCRGRVLDIGAGAGCHALALQERGLAVCAIDNLQPCVEVMKRRGVTDVRCVDIFTADVESLGGPFDTLLSMMNGFAIVKGLAELKPYLSLLRPLVKPDGQFIVDSSDIRPGATPARRAELERKAREGRYFGEMDLALEYKERSGPGFVQLYVDAETLTSHASDAGWSCELIEQEESGRFLARLTLL